MLINQSINKCVNIYPRKFTLRTYWILEVYILNPESSVHCVHMPAPHPVYSELYEKNYSAWIMETNTEVKWFEFNFNSSKQFFMKYIVNLFHCSFKGLSS